jgi:hypothetical protein
MSDYVTVEQVDALLGAGWQGSGDAARAVLMANTWLSAKPLQAFDPVPDAVLQAGAEIAREAAAGKLYAAYEAGVQSKSAAAGSVSSSKTYAAGGGRAVSAGEAFALALLAPYLASGSQSAVVRA